MDKANNLSESNCSATVSIDASRFEQSPYFEFYKNHKTVSGVAAGHYYPSTIGEDPVATYWASWREAVLFDVFEKPWQIDGPDDVPFRERVFARRIENLAIGRGRYAIAYTSEGGTYMDGIFFRLSELCFWYVQPDRAFEEWMIVHRDCLDVKISDPHSRVLQIQGPKQTTKALGTACSNQGVATIFGSREQCDSCAESFGEIFAYQFVLLTPSPKISLCTRCTRGAQNTQLLESFPRKRRSNVSGSHNAW
ncbi:MAG: hypothetical protein ACI845_000615 [Gammaproteobacteria bacterium]|jgi:hypothetical protein